MRGIAYIPSLDGLRALAVLAVVGVHTGVPGLDGGFIGVDVFFVLSGYLITRVLADNPDLRRFYCRRFLRLVPPLALMLGVYLAVAPLVWPGYPHVRDAALAFFYLSDYTRAFSMVPNYLGHTWSLSVEEHFYLLWPLIFLRVRPSVGWLVVAYSILMLWRWWQTDYSGAYFRFDTHCTGLVLGCLVARLPPVSAFPAWPGLAVLALLAMFLPLPWAGNFTQLFGLTLAEIAAAFVILGTAPRWMSNDLLVYIGKLSYGIYLWHYPISRIGRGLRLGWELSAPVTLVLSVALAALSYHTIESAIRKRRETAITAS